MCIANAYFFERGECMKKYFSRLEITLWGVSVALIIASFVIFGGNSALTLVASVIGVTSLIFNAKGNPIGQAFMVVFSILYGIISFTFMYYGEMITYVGMTAPMAFFALIAWLRNPYNGNKSEVRINQLKKKDIVFMMVVTVVVTLVFYFILDFFHTANIITSTISVTTSFIAVYLTYKRSTFFALAYAANDIVLIILWTMAAMTDTEYISVIVCFSMFLVNDIYGFINWSKMRKRQMNKK